MSVGAERHVIVECGGTRARWAEEDEGRNTKQNTDSLVNGVTV